MFFLKKNKTQKKTNTKKNKIDKPKNRTTKLKKGTNQKRNKLKKKLS